VSESVVIGGREVGGSAPSYIVAEIGINHNGQVELAKQLIDAAADAGCDAVKFQKRTIDVVYTPADLARPRESPFGTTNGELKRGLEFGQPEYDEIDDYCRERSITWFASCWDEQSVDFIARYSPPCYKIASASLTDHALLRHQRAQGAPLILSTGMSTLAEIDAAVEALGTQDLVILHSTSSYPARIEELNLAMIATLRRRYGVPVGYSGHEVGLAPSVAAVALGACLVERHLTLDRAMWGSDHAASVEPQGFSRVVRDARVIELAMGDGVKRVYESELPVREKLRRIP
jgi:N-acetylneuraminate synthase